MVLAELGGKLRDSLRRWHAVSNPSQTELTSLIADITRALIESDVNVKLVLQLRERWHEQLTPLLLDNNPKNLTKLVQKAVIEELVNLLTPKSSSSGAVIKPYSIRRGHPNVLLFVGLQGAGKTTTIAKVANHYQRQGLKTALVCADTFRAGALDQLKQNATKLRIPFYGSYTQPDPVIIAHDGVERFRTDRYEIILVDTSGRHKQEASLLEEMQEIASTIRPHNIVLVMDATQGQAVYDQALAFHQAVTVGSVIITKLDGHAKGGGAISAVAATSSPILFLGSGEHFEDLDPFHAQSFVSKMLGFGDVRGLVEAMKNSGGGGDDQQLRDKMSKGEFTLRDMYNQFQKVMNMGPFNKFVGMIPGMPEYLIPKSGDQEATHRLRKLMVIMDSMNNAELDGKVDWHTKHDPTVESRIRRIASGSGSHPNEVKMLLLVHKQFEGMVSRMGKSGMLGKQQQAKQKEFIEQMRRNPHLINQRLNQMDPKVVQQMGGREHVAQMMQQMAKGGGGMDMDALMSGGMPPGMGAGMPGMGAAGMPGMPPGMDMDSLMKMAESMGLGFDGLRR